MDERANPLDAVIIGGGVTGLSLASLLARREPAWRIRVFEREGAAGGKMRTVEEEGYRVDTGPSGVLPAEGGALELAHELGVDPEPASPSARKRWIYRDGGLRALPTGPREFLTTELLGPVGKLRAAAEPLVPAGGNEEETVRDFLARRFGHAVARRLAEPLVLGVTGGDPSELSFDALFPRLRAVEREHGSLVRAMLASARAPAAAGPDRPGDDGSAAPKGSRQRLHGFGPAGMQALTDALARDLGPVLRTGTEVRSLTREGDGWSVRLRDGERFLARRLALTLPAYAAAPLLEPLDAELARGLRDIPYAPMRVIGLGYDRIDVPHALDGFGFLVPRDQNVRSLGVLFTSSLFPGQAPAGKAHLRVLAGGRRDAAIMEADRDTVVRSVRRDLEITLGVVAPPESVTVVDWPDAIPQYRLGHRARIGELFRRAAELPGLALAGSAYHGVGVNDCVADARRVVREWTAPTDPSRRWEDAR